MVDGCNTYPEFTLCDGANPDIPLRYRAVDPDGAVFVAFCFPFVSGDHVWIRDGHEERPEVVAFKDL